VVRVGITDRGGINYFQQLCKLYNAPDRLYIVFANDEIGGQRAIDWISATVQDRVAQSPSSYVAGNSLYYSAHDNCICRLHAGKFEICGDGFKVEVHNILVC
jgi:hypothetical protein